MCSSKTSSSRCSRLNDPMILIFYAHTIRTNPRRMQKTASKSVLPFSRSHCTLRRYKICSFSPRGAKSVSYSISLRSIRILATNEAGAAGLFNSEKNNLFSSHGPEKLSRFQLCRTTRKARKSRFSATFRFFGHLPSLGACHWEPIIFSWSRWIERRNPHQILTSRYRDMIVWKNTTAPPIRHLWFFRKMVPPQRAEPYWEGLHTWNIVSICNGRCWFQILRFRSHPSMQLRNITNNVFEQNFEQPLLENWTIGVKPKFNAHTQYGAIQVECKKPHRNLTIQSSRYRRTLHGQTDGQFLPRPRRGTAKSVSCAIRRTTQWKILTSQSRYKSSEQPAVCSRLWKMAMLDILLMPIVFGLD